MTSDNAAGAAKANRTLRIALIASLALNVLIIGVVAGTLLFKPHHGWRHHKHGPFGILGFARTLPPERADLIRQEVQQAKSTLDPLRDAEDKARDAARAALMAEPFDEARFRAALDDAGVADAAEKKARLTFLADLAAKLTPEERRQLHKWFEKRRARFRRYRDRSSSSSEK